MGDGRHQTFGALRIIDPCEERCLEPSGNSISLNSVPPIQIRMSLHLLEKRPNNKVLIAPLRLLPHAHVAGLVHLLFVVCLCIQAIKRYSRQCFVQ